MFVAGEKVLEEVLASLALGRENKQVVVTSCSREEKKLDEGLNAEANDRCTRTVTEVMLSPT
jgi:hypothetical protein